MMQLRIANEVSIGASPSVACQASFLLLVVMPCNALVTSSFLLLVVRPGAPSSVLAPGSDARSP